MIPTAPQFYALLESLTAHGEGTMIDERKLEDTGLAVALIERFEHWILPLLLDIRAKVDRGETLGRFDIGFLEDVLRDAQGIKPRVDRLPAYQPLYTQVIALCEEITKKGLENEQAGKGPGATG
jgi:hypothetical protein